MSDLGVTTYLHNLGRTFLLIIVKSLFYQVSLIEIKNIFYKGDLAKIAAHKV